MTRNSPVIVIGGGFYGCCLALFLAQNKVRPTILEAGPDLMLRASYVNQARVHGGYHYPRNFMTAWRSLINFPRFVLDFQGCVDSSFEKVYAIARERSKINAFQFRQFCQRIRAPMRQAPEKVLRLFNSQTVEDAFIVEEFAFDADRLRDLMRAKLDEAGVPILLNMRVERIEEHPGAGLVVHRADGEATTARFVFNCAYAGINTVLKQSGLPLLPFKHEITEITLITPPDELRELGITVMDGPFFSTMPFPARNLHSLSHVSYTPHTSWRDSEEYCDAYAMLADTPMRTNFTYMVKDARRFLPAIEAAEYQGSLFEVKTVLIRNEHDDGRPILLTADYGFPGLYNIMGAKIDNIYEMFQFLREIVGTL